MPKNLPPIYIWLIGKVPCKFLGIRNLFIVMCHSSGVHGRVTGRSGAPPVSPWDLLRAHYPYT